MNTKKKTLQAYLVNLIGVVAVFAVFMGLIMGGVLDRYVQGILMLVMINVILATSLNITTGFLGEIALGHAGFMSVGAYSSAIISKAMVEAGLPTWLHLLIVLIVGGIFAAMFGFLIGIPALRLKGDYLAIITLGFGEIIRVVIENLSITGGAQGLRSIPRIATFPITFWVMVVSVTIMFLFIRSRHGRAITAIREDDIASEAAGIPNTYYKVMAFVVAAFFAGVAGALYAHYYAVLGAKTFNFTKSIDILVIVVLGGMGSLTGSIVAAVGLTFLPELLREFSDYRMVVYSVVLIVVMIFRPSGLLGHYEFSLTRFLRKLTGKEPWGWQKKRGEKQKKQQAAATAGGEEHE